jgi:hypothetical protein
MERAQERYEDFSKCSPPAATPIVEAVRQMGGLNDVAKRLSTLVRVQEEDFQGNPV